MITRLFAAAVGLGVLIPALVFGGPVAVEVIVPVVLPVCIWEYAGMAFPEDRAVAAGWLGLVVAALYGSLLYAPAAVHISLLATTLVTFVFCVLRPLGDLKRAADRVGRYLLGMVWMGGFLACLPLLRRLEHGLGWIFLVLAISWLGDTGGYFAGKYLGRHKLYPLVSPKKTWEGVAGGIVLATFGVFIVRAVGLPLLTPVDCIVLGVVLCSAGVVGDLAESLLKRAYEVKDSGSIMPGHGGLLDRIDSVLFVTPLLYVYANLRFGLG